MHTMKVFLRNNGWFVTDNDPITVAEYGTDTIPLPFTRDTPEHLVLEFLRHLNPNTKVIRG